MPRECPEGRAKGNLRTFHSFRHGYAKAALEAGASFHWLSRAMGHSSLSVTSETYGHWESKAAKREADKLEGAFGV